MANYMQCALMALVYRNRDSHVVVQGHADGSFTWQSSFSHEPGALSHASLLSETHAKLGEQAPQAKVLIVVDGGTADYCAHGPALVRIVDLDNEPNATVPSNWEELWKVFGIPVTKPPRSPEAILASLVEAIEEPHINYYQLLQEAKKCLASLQASKP